MPRPLPVARKPKATAKITIWTRAYRPFIMGGDVNQPVCCDVQAEGPFRIGKGYQAYVVTKPSGAQTVAEATTGALIGPSLASVRSDMKTAKLSVVRDQVAGAAVEGRSAVKLPAAQFWKMFR